MPFGIVTAPSIFSRMVRELLKGLEVLDNLLDDILVFTETWKSHIRTFIALFERLRTARLIARPYKCLLGYENLEFLGHNIGQGALKQYKTSRHCEAPRQQQQQKINK